MNRIWKLAVPTIVLLAAAAVPAVPALPAAPQPIAQARCICPDIYAPVCGVNGVTYENSCRAKCAGVAIAHSGPCGSDS